jgi:hypothetical protein
MGCLFVLISLISPRLGIIILWAFTNYISRSFDGFLLPLLGLLFLPWTTLMYVLVQAPAGDVSFFGWVFVGIGILFDLGSYGQAARSQGVVSGGTAKAD